MRNGFPPGIQRIPARQPERFQARNADRVRATLSLWEARGDEHERVFIQIIEAGGITF
jgi:hypothetical protein